MISNSGFVQRCWKCLQRAAVTGPLSIAATCFLAVSASAQWTAADAQGNINSTNTGNVGIGTTSPDVKLVVTSNTGPLPATTGIARFAAADGVMTSVVLDGFNIHGGFLVRRANGTGASPSAVQANNSLGVFGAAGYGSSGYAGTRARIGFFASENWTDTANGTFIAFTTTANGATTSGGTERMRITDAGFVGIGTTAPTRPLDVLTSLAGNGDGARIYRPGQGVGLGTNFKFAFNNSAGTAVDYAGVHATIGSNVASAEGGNLIFTTITAGTLTEKLRISSAGYVGIGTATPGYTLDVQSGQINASGGLCMNGDCKTAWSQVTGTQPWTTSGSDIHYNTGNVGIGTTGALSRLHVVKPANLADVSTANQLMVGVDNTPGYHLGIGYFNVGSWYAGVLQTNSAGSGSALLLNPLGGNIGIGTTVPGQAVEINSASGNNLRLTFNDANGSAANYADLATSSSGDLTVIPSGGDITFSGTGNFSSHLGINRTSFNNWFSGAGVLNVGGYGSVSMSNSTAAGNSFQIGSNNYHDSGWKYQIADEAAQMFMLDGTIALQVAPPGTANGALTWTTGLFVNNSGTVGVGTTSPNSSYKLDAAGQVNASGGLCIAGDCKTAWSQVGGSQWTTAGSAINYNSGNVGVGTSSPQRLMTLSKTDGATLQLVDNVSGEGANDGLLLSQNGLDSYLENSEAGSLNFRTSAATRMIINSSGDVGIGASPTAGNRLDVSGNTKVTGNLNVTGSLDVTGTINARYQDVAEWVPSTHALPAGTVVTLDPTRSNHVEASSKAYDTRVAGVISPQPGLALGEEGRGKVLVATTGRVKIKVDASHGPIEVGDLLVSSNIPGVAMKSKPIDVGDVEIHRPGTLIGKALEPLTKGQGEILVLLSLQ